MLMIAADGEGASKVVEVVVEGARDNAQAKLVAKAIVNSPLVKTAVHGADPNWGRIVMAIGKCDTETDIDPERVRVWIGGVEMYPPASSSDAADAAISPPRRTTWRAIGWYSAPIWASEPAPSRPTVVTSPTATSGSTPTTPHEAAHDMTPNEARPAPPTSTRSTSSCRRCRTSNSSTAPRSS